MAYSPRYYTRGSVEVWDFVRDQSLNYHLGNAVKYICRAGHKDSYADDLKKAIHYLENELSHALAERKSNATGGNFPPGIWSSIVPGSDEDTESFDR